MNIEEQIKSGIQGSLTPLLAQLGEANALIAKLTTERDAAAADLIAARASIASLGNDVTRLDGELAASVASVARLNTEAVALNAKIAELSSQAKSGSMQALTILGKTGVSEPVKQASEQAPNFSDREARLKSLAASIAQTKE